MNSLSWFLYLADVFSGLSILLFVIGSFSLIIALPCMEAYSKEDDKDALKAAKVLSACGIFCILLCICIPSKNTMYAIAASELGEQAYKSEIGQKASKAIEAWIDSQLSKASK